MKKLIANNIGFIVVVGILIFTNLYFYLQWKTVESNQFYYVDAVPHLELIAAMGFYGVDSYQGQLLTSPNPGDVAIGSITGFVTFPNLVDQPRDARQYYRITATDSYDEEGQQLFTLEETLKLNSIPPRSFDIEVLRVAANSPQSVTLESESGQSFRIDKRTEQVTIIDGDGDISTLVTNQSDYRDFMERLLK